jgi:UDP-N-acetylmuramoylalanine--D-glutamate ligase
MAKSQANASNYLGKTIVLMGLSKSTLALAKALHSFGAKIRVSELRQKDHLLDLEKELNTLQPTVEMEFGKHSAPFFEGADFVVLSSLVASDTKPLDEVHARGTPVFSEIDFVLSQVQTPIIGVLGSEGKTTTCVLLKSFLEANKKSVYFSGDLGRPLAEFLSDDKEYDFLLIELSLTQAASLQNFRPHSLIFLNLYQPFPERVLKMDDAQRALQNAFKHVSATTNVIYNHKDNTLRPLLIPVQANKFVFRRKDPAQVSPELVQRYRGAYLASSREMVWLENGKRESFSLSHIPLYGLHNKDNLMAAVTTAKALGVPSNIIQRAMDTFAGVPHRLELIKKKGGVRFVNDSRSTTVECLRKALESFGFDPLILISGGKDTQAEFGVLGDIVKERVKTMILIGESKEHINRCVGDQTETFLVGTFEEAILLSFQKSREGDIILLSPGCEGYDIHTNHEERGNYFKRYVAEL